MTQKPRHLTSALHVSARRSSHLLTSTLIISDSVSESFPSPSPPPPPKTQGGSYPHVARAKGEEMCRSNALAGLSITGLQRCHTFMRGILKQYDGGGKKKENQEKMGRQ